MNNFTYNNDEIRELVLATTEALGLSEPYVIEKDLFVTKAIGILSNINHNNFRLIFQGGTALAKAHNITQRMSEDCDFRLAYNESSFEMKKDLQRKHLRSFRDTLLIALKENGFSINDSDINVRNEGRFISVRAKYNSIFSEINSLKPYLALDFFLGKVKSPTVTQEVTSLIKQTMGESIKHPNYTVSCMSITETAAEKWVALTRRVATIKYKTYYYDKSLVRHIYDLFMINKKYPLIKTEFAKLTSKIIEDDKNNFKSSNIAYNADPVQEIGLALDELVTNKEWVNNWTEFIETMVFGEKPSYDAATIRLKEISDIAIKELRTSS